VWHVMPRDVMVRPYLSHLIQKIGSCVFYREIIRAYFTDGSDCHSWCHLMSSGILFPSELE
jgi:hypothetical protein